MLVGHVTITPPPSLTPPPIPSPVTLPASTGEEAGRNFLDEVIGAAAAAAASSHPPAGLSFPLMARSCHRSYLGSITNNNMNMRGGCGGGETAAGQFRKVQQKKRMVSMSTRCKSSQCVYLPASSITSSNWWFNICSADDDFQQANFPKGISSSSLSSSSLASRCCQLSAA